jgi:BirA family biotin operon repressor/biotin-[acetyl-CoA-carboxylase] ligase
MRALPLDARVLRALRDSAAPLSLAELASCSGSTTEEVTSSIGDLSQAGFEIEWHPHLGIRLMGAPDRLIADDLQSRIGECGLFREIVVLRETESTNTCLLEMGRRGSRPGVVVFAESQTGGRGRLGRRWVSDHGKGLWFSMLLRPELPPTEWTRLTIWAAVATARAIEKFTGLCTYIKWPNDIMIEQRKTVGILMESLLGMTPEENRLVAGIGVNVNHGIEDFPHELRSRAGSLALALGRTIDRIALAARILVELDALFPAAHSDFGRIIGEANRRSFLKNRRVTLNMEGRQVQGIAGEMDARGNLELALNTGEIIRIFSGEVTVLTY